ncbi:MAG: flagellar basal body P-ring formation protein FlgA [Planctomycetaceae bacterium]|nr:flagellar basal body P-ring formation protein FlgA [Planctomycetales bacterium]MCB9873852.1 flagellar basal body P-ring formation protein FlgA [Planctomycetaceae bacterium]MCB9941460.1 flagellar basal body P-ring formation protein FlgA [Planctomycetaceae bacterium]HRX78971.1 flagellar basal body P-ring formation chaperone FlgA [Pirellulaceae bacterium]
MTRTSKTKTALYFLAILVGSWSADAAEVTLRQQSHAKGSLVLLGDVADVTSGSAERIELLKRVELFPAPAQNRSKLMHVRELIELLVLHGIDIDDLAFSGTRTTRIYPAAPAPKVVTVGLQVPASETADMVVVTRRTLNRGDIIRDADVELQPRDPKNQSFQVATERHAVVGMELLYPIREGQTIILNQLRKPLMVKRGELIRVRARAAGVQVTTTAKAMEDGAMGDIIIVQSLENREQYATHVTGTQQVEVYAAGIVASDSASSSAHRNNQSTEKR